MSYPILLVLHLLAAIAFVGTVFFEVLILERVRRHVPAEALRAVVEAVRPEPPAVGRLVAGAVAGAGERPGGRCRGEQALQDSEEDGEADEAHRGDQGKGSMGHASTVAAVARPRPGPPGIGGEPADGGGCGQVSGYGPDRRTR